MTEQKRGCLTDRIKRKSKELLGYEINQLELRLMPYIQYSILNDRRVNPNHVSPEERPILSKWREAGHITGGASEMTMTKKFWDAVSEILWLGYVDIT